MGQQNQVTLMDTLLPFAGIVFLIAIGVILLIQQFRKNLYREQAEQEALKNKHQLEMIRSSMLVQEEERKRIAQDMHDELGAILSINRMHLLQAERKHAGNNGELLADLQNIRSLTENSLESMRRISHQLMPPQLEQFGFIKTLETVCSQLNETKTIQVELVTTEQASDQLTDHLVQLTLYRVCMELINNTIKHAQATQLVLRIDASNETFHVQYSDNGKGLDDATATTGMGMKNMADRLRFLGGEFTVHVPETTGFSAEIHLPFNSLL